jgi:hypothetical protein
MKICGENKACSKLANGDYLLDLVLPKQRDFEKRCALSFKRSGSDR